MKKYQRTPYTIEVTIEPGNTYEFEEITYVDCLIERYVAPFNEATNRWRADVFYNPGETPTILTYEFTEIEDTDVAGVFCIINDSNKLVFKNNKPEPINLKITRRA